MKTVIFKYIILYALICILNPFQSQGQNLCPNPGFEDHVILDNNPAVNLKDIATRQGQFDNKKVDGSQVYVPPTTASSIAYPWYNPGDKREGHCNYSHCGSPDLIIRESDDSYSPKTAYGWSKLPDFAAYAPETRIPDGKAYAFMAIPS